MTRNKDILKLFNDYFIQKKQQIGQKPEGQLSLNPSKNTPKAESRNTLSKNNLQQQPLDSGERKTNNNNFTQNILGSLQKEDSSPQFSQ